MKFEFTVSVISLRVMGGPLLQLPCSFQVTCDVRSWHENKFAEFISTTAGTEVFQMEGKGFTLTRCSSNRTIALTFPLGLIETTGSSGGMSLITDTVIPEGF